MTSGKRYIDLLLLALAVIAFALPVFMLGLGTLVFVPELFNLIEELARDRRIEARRVVLLSATAFGIVGILGLRGLMHWVFGTVPTRKWSLAVQLLCGVLGLTLLAALEHPPGIWMLQTVVDVILVSLLLWVAWSRERDRSQAR